MHCLICNTPTVPFVDEKSGIGYVHCLHCECIGKHQTHHKPILEQKKQYDLHKNSPQDEGYRAYFQRFLDFVLPLVGKPKKALDFGCGRSTLLAQMLAEHGMVCDYYDPLYHPEKQYDSNKYQLIVSTEVFEHLHDPKALFGALLERLEEGGYLALQTQFHSNDIEAFKTWYYRLDPTHVVFFTPRTLNVLAKMHGCAYVGDNGKNMAVIQKI